ncbi:MAG: helix-turn-helix transcriptional regulator [Bacteroidales bacterium]|nr:helix-turn-helix transcriptional regulator [Bacteroidales bacterium]
MQIHIGSIIRDELRRQGRSNAWLADNIGVNIRTVNKIFLKSTIDTQQLYIISRALGIDFFQHYSNTLSSLPDMGNQPISGRESSRECM